MCVCLVVRQVQDNFQNTNVSCVKILGEPNKTRILESRRLNLLVNLDSKSKTQGLALINETASEVHGDRNVFRNKHGEDLFWINQFVKLNCGIN